MNLVIPSAVPPEIVERARALLGALERGEIHSRKSNQQKGYKSLCVGYRYRLFSREANKWMLLTHESYNKLKGKKK